MTHPETQSMFRRSWEMAQSEDVAAYVHSLHEAIALLTEFVSRSDVHKMQVRLAAKDLLEAQSKLANILFYAGVRGEE